MQAEILEKVHFGLGRIIIKYNTIKTALCTKTINDDANLNKQ